jgi:hypothetical protein
MCRPKGRRYKYPHQQRTSRPGEPGLTHRILPSTLGGKSSRKAQAYTALADPRTAYSASLSSSIGGFGLELEDGYKNRRICGGSCAFGTLPLWPTGRRCRRPPILEPNGGRPITFGSGSQKDLSLCCARSGTATPPAAPAPLTPTPPRPLAPEPQNHCNYLITSLLLGPLTAAAGSAPESSVTYLRGPRCTYLFRKGCRRFHVVASPPIPQEWPVLCNF